MEATCPSCGHTTNAPDEYAGRRVKCARCKAAFELPAAGEFDPVAALNAPAPPPRHTGPATVEDQQTAALLRALIAQGKEQQEQLVAIHKHAKRTAFYTMVLALPLIVAILFWIFFVFLGLGAGVRGALSR